MLYFTLFLLQFHSSVDVVKADFDFAVKIINRLHFWTFVGRIFALKLWESLLYIRAEISKSLSTCKIIGIVL